jgi:hypothetical protein
MASAFAMTVGSASDKVLEFHSRCAAHIEKASEVRAVLTSLSKMARAAAVQHARLAPLRRNLADMQDTLDGFRAENPPDPHLSSEFADIVARMSALLEMEGGGSILHGSARDLVTTSLLENAACVFERVAGWVAKECEALMNKDAEAERQRLVWLSLPASSR